MSLEFATRATIRPIDDSQWSDILRLQNDVYFQIQPESLQTLQSKWKNSPTLCFVCVQENRTAAYLLAHAWGDDDLPKLDQSIPHQPRGDCVFLHDLAVSRKCAGQGIGAVMVNYLIETATREGYEKIRLIAIQDSTPFWQKMGFQPEPQQHVCSSYGSNAKAMWRSLLK